MCHFLCLNLNASERNEVMLLPIFGGYENTRHTFTLFVDTADFSGSEYLKWLVENEM